MTDSLMLRLPMPPSVNHYWRKSRHGMYISAEGKAFREAVLLQRRDVDASFPNQRLSVEATLHAPDKRRFDIDNRAKALLDALEKAGFYADDAQVDELVIKRGKVSKGEGHCVVRIHVI